MRFVYRIINVLLLFLMALAIGAFSFWKVAPKKFNSTGKKIIEDYVAQGEERAQKALHGLSVGDSSYAEKTLKAWEDISTDDRYYIHKRKIMLSLSKHLYEEGNYEKSADLMSTGLRENDRDITLFVAWAKSALHLPQLRQRAETELEVMAKRFPINAPLNTLYIKDVLHKGDEAAALEVLSQIRGVPTQLGGWSVLWNVESGKPYIKRFWVRLKPDEKRWVLDIPSPRTAIKFRIDLPLYVRMSLSNIRITSKDKFKAYEMSEITDVSEMQVKGNSLVASGLKTPFFTIATPDWLKTASSDDMVDIKISFKVTDVGLSGVPSN